MAILKVRRYGDPVLRQRAAPVESVTDELRQTIADMVDTMYEEVGIGLAAPQVGIPLRLMVVAADVGRGVQALVNPRIVDQGGSVTAGRAACPCPASSPP
jgi:peptide deformylase